jgi:hypothetical protein
VLFNIVEVIVIGIDGVGAGNGEIDADTRGVDDNDGVKLDNALEDTDGE